MFVQVESSIGPPAMFPCLGPLGVLSNLRYIPRSRIKRACTYVPLAKPLIHKNRKANIGKIDLAEPTLLAGLWYGKCILAAPYWWRRIMIDVTKTTREGRRSGDRALLYVMLLATGTGTCWNANF